jgi:NitT/TauT family transport system ATP-binding protein
MSHHLPQPCSVVELSLEGVKAGDLLGSIDATIPRGEFVTVAGSRPAATLLLRLIAGLERPDSGRVALAPGSVVGVVLDDPCLLDWRTPLGNVMLAVEARRGDCSLGEARARRLLAAAGISDVDARGVGRLPRAHRVRIALCRALVNDPPVLVLDEPFRFLSTVEREELALDLQRVWLERRPTVVAATESLAEAAALSDRVLVLTAAPARVATEIAIALPRPRRFDRATTPHIVEHGNRIRTAVQAVGERV